MRLVVDTNVLVAELLRKRGRDLIESPKLEIYLAEKIKDEVEYELQKRIAIIVSQTRLSEELAQKQLEVGLRLIDSKIITFPQAFSTSLETEARKRIPRDPNDWETIALSLALPAAIWTEDDDFFGCGRPV